MKGKVLHNKYFVLAQHHHISIHQSINNIMLKTDKYIIVGTEHNDFNTPHYKLVCQKLVVLLPWAQHRRGISVLHWLHE